MHTHSQVIVLFYPIDLIINLLLPLLVYLLICLVVFFNNMLDARPLTLLC